MKHIQFFVQGEPKGQPRPRAFARRFGKKWAARVYDSGTAEGWKSLIASASKEFIPETPFEFPVRVNSTFYFPRPATHYRANGELKDWAPLWHLTKPDRDNLDKCVLDALTILGFWTDDKIVVDGRVQKKYVQGKGYAPGALIEITEAVL